MSDPDARGHKNFLEWIFEHALWNSRLLVLVAVIASLVEAINMFFVATVDTFRHVTHIWEYASGGSDQDTASLRGHIITGIVETIDGYLLATVMLILSFGLYELFISRIDAAEKSDRSSRVLVIHSLDDLKERLAQVVLLILVVKFFEHALTSDFKHVW